MKEEHISWDTVEETGKLLGATDANIKKWAQRGSIPDKWLRKIATRLGLMPKLVVAYPSSSPRVRVEAIQ